MSEPLIYGSYGCNGRLIAGEANERGLEPPAVTVVSRLRMADPYVVTGACGLAVTERVLDGTVSSGYRTPGGAFGPEFVLGIDEAEGFFDEDDPP